MYKAYITEQLKGAKMQIYMVGGAVRDKILGIPVHDKDHVVTGSTEEELLALGYKKVGKSFPVFLHPETGEEYALARKEIKTGTGHKDFKFLFTPDITLEEDSLRRDFTCNALYQNLENGEIIDFHNGKDDIKNRVLRHISEHFEEDPLRVLRTFRFAAQLNFKIAPETMELCQRMVKNGALENLSKDRIWQEFEKALKSGHFHIFIETARQCGALQIMLPEMEQMFNIPERLDYHPEGNSGAHTILSLKAADSKDAMVNFATMLHDIGKIKTDPKCWPSHHGHDKYGVDVIKSIGKRLKVPNKYIEFAIFTAENHMIYHRKIADVQKELADIAIKLSHFHQKDICRKFIEVLYADMHGRAKEVENDEEQCFADFSRYLEQLFATAENKKVSEVPAFETLITGIKEGTLAPSKLNEAYITLLLNETPYLPKK